MGNEAQSTQFNTQYQVPYPNTQPQSYQTQPIMTVGNRLGTPQRAQSRSNSRERNSPMMTNLSHQNSRRANNVTVGGMPSYVPIHNGNQVRTQSPARHIPPITPRMNVPGGVYSAQMMPQIPKTPQTNNPYMGVQPQNNTVNNSFNVDKARQKSRDKSKQKSRSNQKPQPPLNPALQKEIQVKRNKLRQMLSEGSTQLPTTICSNLKVSFL